MSWFRVDDTMPGNAKAFQCPLEAIGLWTLAGAWSAQQLTAGFIPDAVLPMLRGNEALASTLLQAKLWERSDGGYQFHDWEQYQPTVDEVKEQRSKRAEAGRKGGIASGVARRNASRSKREANASSKREAKNERASTPSHPIPSPIEEPNGSSLVRLTQGASGTATAPADAGADTKPKSRGTRLPDGWFPDRTEVAKKLEAAHDSDWLQRELERFSDYWQAKTGQQATKLDWTKTWCNWLRNAEDRQPHTRQQETDDWYARSQQRAAAGINVFTEMMKDAQK